MDYKYVIGRELNYRRVQKILTRTFYTRLFLNTKISQPTVLSEVLQCFPDASKLPVVLWHNMNTLDVLLCQFLHVSMVTKICPHTVVPCTQMEGTV